MMQAGHHDSNLQREWQPYIHSHQGVIFKNAIRIAKRLSSHEAPAVPKL